MFVRGFFLFLISLALMAGSSSNAVKSGYWGSWNPQGDAASIDTTLFTHVYYAFALPNTGSFELDLVGDSAPQRLLYFTNTLRSKNPAIKIILSIGGGGLYGLDVFARMASSEGSRRIFINSAIRAARDHGFDGLDLDWEYPQTVKEMNDLGILLNEWRVEIQSEARATARTALLLAAAVRYTSVINYPADRIRSYPVQSIAQNLDWINIMSYDHHGDTWARETSAHTDIRITRDGVANWIQGVPRQKLVLGLAMYGRVWNLQDPNVKGIGAPATVASPAEMRYSEILDFNNANGAQVVRDEASQSVYASAGRRWIGYDDEESIRRKVVYARQQGLRGYFFWEIGQDSNRRLAGAASNA